MGRFSTEYDQPLNKAIKFRFIEQLIRIQRMRHLDQAEGAWRDLRTQLVPRFLDSASLRSK